VLIDFCHPFFPAQTLSLSLSFTQSIQLLQSFISFLLRISHITSWGRESRVGGERESQREEETNELICSEKFFFIKRKVCPKEEKKNFFQISF
jgi:hypothetical protein